MQNQDFQTCAFLVKFSSRNASKSSGRRLNSFLAAERFLWVECKPVVSHEDPFGREIVRLGISYLVLGITYYEVLIGMYPIIGY